jgi:hypothetical protein
VIAIATALMFLPRSRDLKEPGTSDLAGAALLGSATLLTLWTLAQLADPGQRWPWVGVAAAVALVAGVGFWRVEGRAKAPLISPARIRDAGIASGLGGALLGYLVLFAPLVLYPQVVRQWNLATGGAGLVLTCLPAGFALTALLGTRLGRAVSNPVRVRVGAAAAAVSAALQCLEWASPLVVAGLLLISGASLGVVLPANNAMVMTSVPESASAVTGGMINVARALGTSLGVAMTALGVRVGLAHGWASPPLVMAALSAACVVLVFTAGPVRRPDMGI